MAIFRFDPQKPIQEIKDDDLDKLYADMENNNQKQRESNSSKIYELGRTMFNDQNNIENTDQLVQYYIEKIASVEQTLVGVKNEIESISKTIDDKTKMINDYLSTKDNNCAIYKEKRTKLRKQKVDYEQKAGNKSNPDNDTYLAKAQKCDERLKQLRSSFDKTQEKIDQSIEALQKEIKDLKMRAADLQSKEGRIVHNLETSKRNLMKYQQNTHIKRDCE